MLIFSGDLGPKDVPILKTGSTAVAAEPVRELAAGSLSR